VNPKKGLLFLIWGTGIIAVKCQPACETNSLSNPLYYFDELVFKPNTSPSPIYFSFDSYTKYLAGITLYGIMKLWIKADTQMASGTNDVVWALHLHVDNDGAPTPPNEWKMEFAYGNSGNPPLTDSLYIQVRSPCNIPQMPPGFTNPFSSVASDYPVIPRPIDPNYPPGTPCPSPGASYPPTGCPQFYNWRGSYNDYQSGMHMTFIVDAMVRPPSRGIKPGLYKLNLKACLFQVECP